MATFFRLLAIATVVAFLALLFVSFGQPASIKSSVDAQSIVFQDLDTDPKISNVPHQYALFSSEQDPSGQWSVVVKVTLYPHTSCPVAFIRTYQLLPIRHGLDEVVTKDCSFSSPIAFPEEAIIAASKSGRLDSIRPLVKVCGYELPLVEEKVKAYCADADYAKLRRESSSLAYSAKWFTEWRGSEGTVYIGLDANGREIT